RRVDPLEDRYRTCPERVSDSLSRDEAVGEFFDPLDRIAVRSPSTFSEHSFKDGWPWTGVGICEVAGEGIKVCQGKIGCECPV
ncbi:hypothetical protein, partial [Klebsiella pneumoniae]|uniref:hypothetical protein n=1 Tax=Klebsiella pneumoniae TaxID=573 RepID=UPI001953654C